MGDDVSHKPGTVRRHRAPFAGLEEKCAPAHTALLIIDVLNDFCAEGGMISRAGEDVRNVHRAIPPLRRLLQAARAAGALPVFVQSVYSTPENWYLSDVWLDMASRKRNKEAFLEWDGCPPNSWQSDFYDDIRPAEGEPVVVKHRYSAFHNTDLELILRAHGIRTLVTAGIATNVCVETTAREGFVRDYYVVFPSDATAAYHDRDHEATLRTIRVHFGEVVTADEIICAWDRR